MAKNTVNDNTTENGRREALEAARLQIDKEFGKGSLMKLGDNKDVLDVDVIPSGSILLDEALGVGGYPKGRIIEIYGPESSGKTTLALHAISECQRMGGIAAFIDAEHALDPVYAKNLGVNIDDLWISQPDNGEQALEITERLVRSGAIDIVVVDSVAALTPQAEIEGDMGDSHVGLQARLMSQALRKLTGILAKSNTTIIFINQIRIKIGVMFGTGISKMGSLLDAAVKYDIIEKSGAWYAYNGEKIGQGRDKTLEYLTQNPDFTSQIDSLVREKMFPKKEDKTEEAEDKE